MASKDAHSTQVYEGLPQDDEKEEPPDRMEQAKIIFAHIASTSPDIVVDEGTKLDPQEVTRALVQRGYRVDQIMAAEIKIKQLIAPADKNPGFQIDFKSFLASIFPIIQELDNDLEASRAALLAGDFRPFTAPAPGREKTPLPHKHRPTTTGGVWGVEMEFRRLKSSDPLIRQYGMQNLMARAKRGGAEIDRVLEQMVERVEKDDFLMRGFAVTGLSKTGDGEMRNYVVEALIHRVTDEDDRVRMRAVRALREACVAGSVGAIEAIVRASDDEVGMVRDTAAEVAISIAEGCTLPMRARLMESATDGVRIAVVQACKPDVAALDVEAARLVGGAARDSSMAVRLEVVSTLCGVVDKKRAFSGLQPAQDLGKEIIGFMVTLLSDPRQEVKRCLLSELRCESAYTSDKLLQAAIKSTARASEQLRKVAVSWLSNACNTRITLGDDSGIKRMVDLMQTPDGGSMARAAGEVAGQIVIGGSAKYQKMVLPLCKHPDEGVRCIVVVSLTQAMIKVTPAALYEVIAMLQDSSAVVRREVVKCLGRSPVGSREVSTAIIPLLADDDKLVRFEVAEALSAVLDQGDMEQKLKIADMLDQYSNVKTEVVRGLWVGQSYRSFDVGFVGAHTKNNFEIQQSIIRALSRLGIPLEIIMFGSDAIRACIQRHYLGFGYDLPPTFHEDRAKQAALEAAMAKPHKGMCMPLAESGSHGDFQSPRQAAPSRVPVATL